MGTAHPVYLRFGVELQGLEVVGFYAAHAEYVDVVALPARLVVSLGTCGLDGFPGGHDGLVAHRGVDVRPEGVCLTVVADAAGGIRREAAVGAPRDAGRISSLCRTVVFILTAEGATRTVPPGRS